MTYEELATKYLRALAKRDMAVWRNHTERQNKTLVPEDIALPPSPSLKSEASYQRLIRAARTSPEYLERNT